MRRVRRHSDEPRLEVMPLVDVIFLLLTFFVFAMVLMVRVDALTIQMPRFGAGDAVEPRTIITIAIDRDGATTLNGEPVAIEQIGAQAARLVEAQAEDEGQARVHVAADERAVSGALLRVLDALSAEGVRDVAVIGRPAPSESAPPPDAASPRPPE